MIDRRRMRDVFNRVVDLAPGARTALLDAECGDDDALRREVEELLEAADAAAAFLETPAGAAGDAAPAPARVGRYEILGLLGRGGMGVVYRARDPRGGPDVALKTIALESGAIRTCLRREIHALRRLDHPGIVRILDEGEQEEGPWYAMELVDGATLHARMAAARGRTETTSTWWTVAHGSRVPDHPLSSARTTPLPRAALEPLLTSVRSLCAPLAYLHGEGLVHRDVKPENVIVRPDGRSVITDFGLAAHTGARRSREVLDVHAAGGTRSYVAPEQARGELVDARADLYALGCIIHEIVAGVPPADLPPGSTLTRLVPDLPPTLDDLIARLLSPDPARRPGYAMDVARVLHELLGEIGDDDAGPRPEPYLYRAAFTGHGDAVARIEEAVARLVSGRGAMICLEGESGAGKTRLALEVARRARGRGIQILTGGAAGAPGPTRPLEPLRAPLISIGDTLGGLPGLVDGAAILRKLIPESFPGTAEPDRAEQPALSPADVRRSVCRAVTSALDALARRGPVLTVLDDLDGIDPMTLALLSELAATRWLDQRPILLLLCYRSGERDDLPVGGSDAVVRIGRLERDQVGDLMQGMLAIAPSPDLLDAVFERSDGNPLFVGEYLRSLVSDGTLARRGAGGWHVTSPERLASPVALPASVHALIARRIDRLDDGARLLLDAASVLGREMDHRLLAGLAAGSVDPLAGIATLLARELLAEESPGRYRFAHDRVREVAYEHVTPARRRSLHLAAASALAARTDGGETLGWQAAHWESGGDVARARTSYLQAARAAARSYAVEDAERSYRAFLRLAPPPAESVTARFELVQNTLVPMGRGAEAVATLEDALATARAIDDPRRIAMALRGIAILAIQQGRDDAAGAALDEELRIVERLGDDAGIARVHGTRANLQRDRGRPADAAASYLVAIDAARKAGSRRLEAHLLLNSGLCEHDAGRRDRADELYRAALALALEEGDEALEGSARANLGDLERETGRLDDAESSYRRALELAKKTKRRGDEAHVLGCLAAVARDGGRLAEACTLLGRSVELHRAVGELRAEGIRQGELCEVAVALGDHPAAWAALTRAEELLHPLGDRPLWLRTVRRRMALCRATGRPLDAVLAEVRRLRAEEPPGGPLVPALADLEREIGRDVEPE